MRREDIKVGDIVRDIHDSNRLLKINYIGAYIESTIISSSDEHFVGKTWIISSFQSYEILKNKKELYEIF